jgi:hypothetical protein
MRKSARSCLLVVLALIASAVLGITAMFGSAASLAASTALIMGGTGTPNPDQEPGYVPNVTSYYIAPNSSCNVGCTLVSVFTPETAWPLYGGLSALTWKQSILQGSDLYDTAVRAALQNSAAGDKIILFGYSQSGAILAIEKDKIANDPVTYDKSKLEIVVIGNVSRPNGGLNARLPITVPIVEFPYGPPMPTDTGVPTTDIAMKWDIIADAPLYVTNLLAMLNALIGGPGFGIVHGTYPNPEGVPPSGTVGGYTQAEWQAMMDAPENYPDIIDIQTYGDTKYITVTPKVLPLVEPLHMVGLGVVADLIEPALRVIIEETAYDRSIPYGQPTPFRLIPIFNPITLAIDVAAAIPQGIAQALGNLGVGATTIAPAAPAPVSTTTVSTLAATSAPVEEAKTATVASDTVTAVKTSTPRLTVVTDGNTTEQPAVEQKQSTGDIATETTKYTASTPNNSSATGPDVTVKKDETKKDSPKGSVSLNFSSKKHKESETGGATAGQNGAPDTTAPAAGNSEQAAA